MRKSASLHERDKALGIELSLERGDEVVSLMTRGSGLFVVSRNRITKITLPDILDPSRVEKNAPVEQSIYFSFGSTDYIVARTILQTAMILEHFFPRSSDKYKKISDVSWEIMNSLMLLRSVRDRIAQQVEKSIEIIEADIEVYRSGVSPKPLPIVPYFEIEFRSFANEVRRALNKLSELFNILTHAKIEAGQFHKAHKWTVDNLGENSELAQMIGRDLTWIKLWIDLRIAIEHPKPDKYVETLNFSLQPDRIIRLPTWRFIHPEYKMSNPQNTLEIFQFCIDNILKFYEDMLIMLLDGHQFPNLALSFVVIDEDKRDAKKPYRWKVSASFV